MSFFDCCCNCIASFYCDQCGYQNPPFPGVTVTMRKGNSSGDVVFTTVTGADGYGTDVFHGPCGTYWITYTPPANTIYQEFSESKTLTFSRYGTNLFHNFLLGPGTDQPGYRCCTYSSVSSCAFPWPVNNILTISDPVYSPGYASFGDPNSDGDFWRYTGDYPGFLGCPAWVYHTDPYQRQGITIDYTLSCGLINPYSDDRYWCLRVVVVHTRHQTGPNQWCPGTTDYSIGGICSEPPYPCMYTQILPPSMMSSNMIQFTGDGSSDVEECWGSNPTFTFTW